MNTQEAAFLKIHSPSDHFVVYDYFSLLSMMMVMKTKDEAASL